MELATIEGGRLIVRLHDGQRRAMASPARFVVVLAGTQSGKTSFGPHWLLREMQDRGPGDYLVVTPTFPLLELKLLPEFRRLFVSQMQLGRYTGSPVRRWVMSDSGARRLFGEVTEQPTRVLFGYAGDPDSLESATCKAAWLDEAGQKAFKVGAYEAVMRRLSLAEGRVLITTTIYSLGWLKDRLYDKAGTDKKIEVVNFPSIANPAFPRTEFERARADLPLWKFKMQYLGQYERPAGLIYDCVGDDFYCKRFVIPRDWRRFVGVDFGQQNMAATFWAQDPETERLYCYREYHQGGLSVLGHVRRFKRGEFGLPWRCVGGSASEDDWRGEFAAAGYPIQAPRITDVELGIDRVYGAVKAGMVRAFDDLGGLRDEFATYSRKLDDAGEPTEDIEDKNSFHLLDSVRYIIGAVRPAAPKAAKAARRLRSFYG
jgi:hypothetical protein